jgi:hypothetical protein
VERYKIPSEHSFQFVPPGPTMPSQCDSLPPRLQLLNESPGRSIARLQSIAVEVLENPWRPRINSRRTGGPGLILAELAADEGTAGNRLLCLHIFIGMVKASFSVVGRMAISWFSSILSWEILIIGRPIGAFGSVVLTLHAQSRR